MHINVSLSIGALNSTGSKDSIFDCVCQKNNTEYPTWNSGTVPCSRNVREFRITCGAQLNSSKPISLNVDPDMSSAHRMLDFATS